MSNATTSGPMAMAPFDVENYTCSDVGLMFPAINEYTWSKGSRATLYLAGLLWCFLGVAILADVFMSSIERITSKTRTVSIMDTSVTPHRVRNVELKVWNDTVANLSLLAMGTSAPEILLSVIEIVGNNFKAGELGPGTIVGSAAFNLLVISAICISAIPEGDTRRVKSVKVFAITGFTCVFSYVWMALVLLVISPEIVEIWEAALTFLFFPLLIIIAYVADKNFFMKKGPSKHDDPEFVGIPMSEENADSIDVNEIKPDDDELTRLAKELGREKDLPPEEAARIISRKMMEEKSHSKAWYRLQASRSMSGGRKLLPQVSETYQSAYDNISSVDKTEGEEGVSNKNKVDHSKGDKLAVVEFTAASVAVMENEGKVRLGIKRTGKMDIPCSVKVETINGTAVAGEDYKTFNKIVKFKKGESLQEIYIEIVDDCEWEPDEFFFVKLRADTVTDAQCVLGTISINQVTIINDDEPGVLSFSKPSFVIKESGLKALIPVVRMNGADGHVSVKWASKDLSAKEGIDYSGKGGEIFFDNQETTKNIIIPLFESNKEERDENFQIDLIETTGGASIGKVGKTIVTIVNDDEFNGLVSRIMNMTKANLDSLELHKTTYVQQFVEAMNVNGGEIESATFMDYILHFATFFWKVLFAFIPPAQYLGGWPAFFISLGVIGFITAIIGDLASIFGCLIGLEDSITAITLVALGTSMPDTFASKTAALMEKTADSSVGNVNGSNSVNVFLGVGLPWLIASIYWYAKDGSEFEVPAASLGFSVILYTVAAIIALSILVLRRFTVGAELGGPTVPKYISSAVFVTLWVLYILLSALNAKGVINVRIGV